jgi:hypothetical protein
MHIRVYALIVYPVFNFLFFIIIENLLMKSSLTSSALEILANLD